MSKRRIRWVLGCTLLLAEGGPAALAANSPELPVFQPGMWEYRRTMFNQGADKPQVSTVRKCSDPTSEIRLKMASLKGKSCQFEALRHTQDNYVSTWTCQTPNGPMRFHDVLTVTGATKYTDVSEAQMSQRVTRSRLEAVRVGECPAQRRDLPKRLGE
jgi:Protein of unknown function (DUF3617)